MQAKCGIVVDGHTRSATSSRLYMLATGELAHRHRKHRFVSDNRDASAVASSFSFRPGLGPSSLGIFGDVALIEPFEDVVSIEVADLSRSSSNFSHNFTASSDPYLLTWVSLTYNRVLVAAVALGGGWNGSHGPRHRSCCASPAPPSCAKPQASPKAG